MSKAFLIGIVIFLLGCSAGSLSVDATDYASLCKQAEQEGKNVVVLVTAADCPVCHGLLREWTELYTFAKYTFSLPASFKVTKQNKHQRSNRRCRGT